MNIQVQKDGSLLAGDTTALKAYFTEVIKLAKNQDETAFVVDMDDVWPLAYTRKDNCLRDLRKDFIKDVDYSEEPIESEGVGRKEMEIMLTLKCMEFLIARKVRPVFEVYRQMFHLAIQKASVQTNWQTKLLSYEDHFLPLSDENTPYELRDYKHGWVYLGNFRTPEYMFLLARINDYEQVVEHPTSKEQRQREFILAHFPIAFNLINIVCERYSNLLPSGARADLLMAREHLADWRTEYECYTLEGRKRLETPVGFDYSWTNCLRALTNNLTIDEVWPTRRVKTKILGDTLE